MKKMKRLQGSCIGGIGPEVRLMYVFIVHGIGGGDGGGGGSGGGGGGGGEHPMSVIVQLQGVPGMSS